MNKLLLNWFKPWIGLPAAIWILCLSRVVTAMGCFVMPLLTLILTRRIGLDSGAAGLVLTIGSALYVPAAAIGGRLTDHWGRKEVYLTFSFLAAVLYAICGFLPPSGAMVAVLLAAQFLMNVMDPAAGAMLADLTTAAQRKSANSLSYMGWNVGFAVGPMVGGLLFESHLPWVFWGDAMTTVLGLTLILLFIRIPARGKAMAKDGEKHGTIVEGKPEPDGQTAGEDPVLSEAERHVSGSVWRVLRDRPVLIVFSLLNFLFSFVYSQWGFLLPMQTAEDFGIGGAAFYGLLASLNGLLVIVMTPVVTRVTHSLPHLTAMTFGGLMYAFSLGSLFLARGHAAYFAVIALFTLGEVFVTLNAGTFVSIQTPASHRGRVSAVTNSIGGAGFAIGPLTMGAAAGLTGLRGTWLIVGVLALAGAGAMLVLEIRLRSERHR